MTVAPPELRNTLCPNCGYALKGLADDAACPECGRLRDNTEIVLYGYPVGQNPAARTTIAQWFSILFGLAILVMVFWVADWYLILFFLLSMGWGLLAHLDRRHPGVIQVRILPDGVVQFSHGGMMTAIRRVQVQFLWIVPLLVPPIFGAWLYARGLLEAVIAVGFAWCVLMPLSIILFRDAMHYWRSRRRLAATALADSNIPLHRLTPWASIRRIAVTSIGPNCHRLVLKRRQRFFTLDNSSHVVDADVTLSNEAARVLRELLINRCGGLEGKHPGRPQLNETISNLKSEI